MIKLHLLLLGFLSFTSLASYTNATGLVNEFEIGDSKNVTSVNVTRHSNTTNHNVLPVNQKNNTNTKQMQNVHSKNLTHTHDTSMYTEADLEETSSETDLKFDNPNTNEYVSNITKEKNKKKNKETEMSNIYTDSDLEATASKDKKKHGDTLEKEKKSAGSYLFVPHKREITDTEQEEGSGEGSGNEPSTNDFS